MTRWTSSAGPFDDFCTKEWWWEPLVCPSHTAYHNGDGGTRQHLLGVKLWQDQNRPEGGEQWGTVSVQMARVAISR
jgi:hypothetical protein